MRVSEGRETTPGLQRRAGQRRCHPAADYRCRLLPLSPPPPLLLPTAAASAAAPPPPLLPPLLPAADLDDGIDDNRPGTEALHALVAAPEADVVLEGQHVEHRVKERHANRKSEVPGVGLEQDALELQGGLGGAAGFGQVPRGRGRCRGVGEGGGIGWSKGGAGVDTEVLPPVLLLLSAAAPSPSCSLGPALASSFSVSPWMTPNCPWSLNDSSICQGAGPVVSSCQQRQREVLMMTSGGQRNSLS